MLLGFISHQGNEPEWGKYTVDTKCWYDYRQHAIGRNIKLVRPLGGLHHSGWTWSVSGVWHFHFQEYGPQSTHRPSQKACSRMFIALLFPMPKNWILPKCP